MSVQFRKHLDRKPGRLAGVLAAALLLSSGTIPLYAERPPVDTKRESSGLAAFIVSGSSMSPALLPGDTVVVDTRITDSGLHRGDIVAIQVRNRARPLVKRVISTAGERLTIESGGLAVDGTALMEPYLASPRRIEARGWSVLRTQLNRSGGVVPSGHLVVLGDSPASDEDSALFGWVALSQVIGRVVAVRDATGAFARRKGIPDPPSRQAPAGQSRAPE